MASLIDSRNAHLVGLLSIFGRVPFLAVSPDYQFEKIKRYYFFEVYDAVEADDGWLWYDIGNGMWINQQYVSLVGVNKRPDDIGTERQMG